METRQCLARCAILFLNKQGPFPSSSVLAPTQHKEKKRNDSVANSVNDSVHRFHPTVEYYSLLFLQQAKKALNLEDNPFLPTNNPQSDALPGNKGGSGDVAEKRE